MGYSECRGQSGESLASPRCEHCSSPASQWVMCCRPRWPEVKEKALLSSRWTAEIFFTAHSNTVDETGDFTEGVLQKNNETWTWASFPSRWCSSLVINHTQHHTRGGLIVHTFKSDTIKMWAYGPKDMQGDEKSSFSSSLTVSVLTRHHIQSQSIL